MVILHIKVSPEVAKLSGCGYPRNGSREFEFSAPPKHFGQSWSLQTPHALAIRSSGVPGLLGANLASTVGMLGLSDLRSHDDLKGDPIVLDQRCNIVPAFKFEFTHLKK